MTDEEVLALKRGDRVLYEGEVWNFKSCKRKYGRQLLEVTIQRGNSTFHSADPKDLTFYDHGKQTKSTRNTKT